METALFVILGLIIGLLVRIVRALEGKPKNATISYVRSLIKLTFKRK